MSTVTTAGAPADRPRLAVAVVVLLSACPRHTDPPKDEIRSPTPVPPRHVSTYWMESSYASLWAQGGRGELGTPATEKLALGYQFVIAGYAVNTESGPAIRRATDLAVCEGAGFWPSEANGVWVVAWGKLAFFEACEGLLGVSYDCPRYLLSGCQYEIGIRPEDVEPVDYDVMAGPWRPGMGGLVIGAKATVTGQLLEKEFFGDRILVDQTSGKRFFLRGCRFDSAPPTDRIVSVQGRVNYLPAAVPQGMTLAQSWESASHIIIEECTLWDTFRGNDRPQEPGL